MKITTAFMAEKRISDQTEKLECLDGLTRLALARVTSRICLVKENGRLDGVHMLVRVLL